MGTERKTSTIGDVAIATVQLPATEAIELQMELIKVGGGLIASLAKGGDIDIGAFQHWASDMEPQAAVAFLKKLCCYAFINEEKITPQNFDIHFSGDKLALAYQVALFVITSNFSGVAKLLGESTGGGSGAVVDAGESGKTGTA